jgi:hypothetical protein
MNLRSERGELPSEFIAKLVQALQRHAACLVLSLACNIHFLSLGIDLSFQFDDSKTANAFSEAHTAQHEQRGYSVCRYSSCLLLVIHTLAA